MALSSPLRIEDAATATALKELHNRSCTKFKTGEPMNINPKQHRELEDLQDLYRRCRTGTQFLFSWGGGCGKPIKHI
jgi:hypothetical protein